MCVQLCLQSYLVFGDNGVLGGSKIRKKDLIKSILSAIVNTTIQIWRMALESGSVNQSFIHYILDCFMARINWVPFIDQIATLKSKLSAKMMIDYKIEYNLPIISKRFKYKQSLNFQFSDSTLRLCIHSIFDEPFFERKI